MAGVSHEEPILSRLDRVDNILRQLEEIRNEGRSPKSSSCTSTMSSEGQEGRSSYDLSPKSMEKNCRPIDDVITETELKGSLIDRLHHLEQRVLKLGLELEREAQMHTPDPHQNQQNQKQNTRKKKGLKQMVKSLITTSRHKSNLAS